MASDFRADTRNLVRFGKKLDAVAGNAAEASRTIELTVGECKSIAVKAQLTYDSATALVITAYGSMDGGTTYQQLQSETVTGGTGTLYDYSSSKASGGADTGFIKDYAVACYDSFKIIVSATSGVAADKINAWVYGSLV